MSLSLQVEILFVRLFVHYHLKASNLGSLYHHVHVHEKRFAHILIHLSTFPSLKETGWSVLRRIIRVGHLICCEKHRICDKSFFPLFTNSSSKWLNIDEICYFVAGYFQIDIFNTITAIQFFISHSCRHGSNVSNASIHDQIESFLNQ